MVQKFQGNPPMRRTHSGQHRKSVDSGRKHRSNTQGASDRLSTSSLKSTASSSSQSSPPPSHRPRSRKQSRLESMEIVEDTEGGSYAVWTIPNAHGLVCVYWIVQTCFNLFCKMEHFKDTTLSWTCVQYCLYSGNEVIECTSVIGEHGTLQLCIGHASIAAMWWSKHEYVCVVCMGNLWIRFSHIAQC